MAEPLVPDILQIYKFVCNRAFDLAKWSELAMLNATDMQVTGDSLCRLPCLSPESF